MKYNIIFISIIIFLLPVFLFADQEDDVKAEISILLDKGLEENFDEIQTLSEFLEYGTAYKLYVINQREFAFPILLNSFAGFGIGSFVQGDRRGGVITLLGDFFFAGVALFGEFMIQNNPSMTQEMVTTMSICYLGGLTGLVIVRIYEIVRPIRYAKSYNKRLYSALTLDRKDN